MKAKNKTYNVCSYWDRQVFREQDDLMLAGMSDMPTGLADSMTRDRDEEDEEDPACGNCEACCYEGGEGL